jgi:DNA-directed RNA polymerase specialized sigma24 family protein
MQSSDPDPYQVVANNEEAMKFRTQMITVLEDDDLAFQVMDCLWAGFKPAEMAEYLGKSVAEINNAQKRLRRKVEKVQDTYKKGGKNV